MPDYTKTIEHNGYRLIYFPEHPAAWKRNFIGYVYEHRLVVESRIGRYLRTEEHVHHINQVRSDNRDENLQLVSRQEHARIHRRLKPEREIKLTCPQCHREFWRVIRNTHFQRGRGRTFCSRRCIGLNTVDQRKWRPRKRAKTVPNPIREVVKGADSLAS